jgi:hypothetical protein
LKASTVSDAKPGAPVQGAKAAAADDKDELRIGTRPQPVAHSPRSAEDEKILENCKVLLFDMTAGDSERKGALAALQKDRAKSSAVVLGSLDPSSAPDADVRLAALAGIEALQPTGPEVSKRLAQSAMVDPEENVRKKTAALIKSRNDEWAMDTMVRSYIAAFDEAGQVRNPILKEAAGGALRELNDKRVYNAMLYYATLEIRTETSELANLATRQIDSFTVNNGAQNTVLTPLSFPIQFPELKITSVKTTVVAPCAALSSLSGENFGNDLDAWAKWIRRQK